MKPTIRSCFTGTTPSTSAPFVNALIDQKRPKSELLICHDHSAVASRDIDVSLVAADATHDVTGNDVWALSIAGLDAFSLELRQCLVNGIQDNVRHIIDRKLEFELCQSIRILRSDPTP
ncbi:MAG: hypothetical protein AAGA73_05100 [Pseudomonadota bacterium]